MGTQANKNKKRSRKWSCVRNRLAKMQPAEAIVEGDCPPLPQHRESSHDSMPKVNDACVGCPITLKTLEHGIGDFEQVSMAHIFKSQPAEGSLHCNEPAELNLLSEQRISGMPERHTHRDVHELDEEVVRLDDSTKNLSNEVLMTSENSAGTAQQHCQHLSKLNICDETSVNNNTDGFQSFEVISNVSTDIYTSIPHVRSLFPMKEAPLTPLATLNVDNACKYMGINRKMHDNTVTVPIQNYGRVYVNSMRQYVRRTATVKNSLNKNLHDIDLQSQWSEPLTADPPDRFVNSSENFDCFGCKNPQATSPALSDEWLPPQGSPHRSEEDFTHNFDYEPQTSDHDDIHSVQSQYSNHTDAADTNIDIHTPDISEDEECTSSVPDSAAQLNEKFQEAKVDGLRIVDLNYMFQTLHEKFNQHKDCEGLFKDLRVYKVTERGMRTLLHVACVKCQYKDRVWTNPQAPVDRIPLVESAVYASLTAGVGFSTLQELLAGMSVPFVSPNIYRNNRSKLVSVIKALCEKEFLDAGKEEKELAIAEGRLLLGKYPWTAVIGDGVWCKRSYAHGRHDALSGAAVLVGVHSKRILFVGVRNKYCSMCKRYETLGEKVPEHTCYKNWGQNQASTAMEPDIILEGFSKSMETHGLIYKTYIGDGDSSVLDKLVDNDVYREYDVSIDKTECEFHLYRCLGTKMDVISKQKAENPLPRGEITKLRTRVRQCGLDMRRYVEARIDYYQNSDLSEANKISKLVDEIGKMIGHFFGNHTLCDSSFDNCNRSEKDVTPYLREVGFYSEIEKAVHRIIINVPSLLKHENTNPAEWYNSIQNKATGGRRINYSLRDSYLARAYVAALQFNTHEALSKFFEYRGVPIPTTVAKMEASRNAQNERTASYREKNKRKRRFTQGPDKNYGVNCNKPDLSSDMYQRLVGLHFEKLTDRLLRQDEIQKQTVDQSQSAMWKDYRKWMLTASKFGQICRMRETTSCHNLVCAILYAHTIDTEATRYGLANEAQAIKDLAKVLNEEISPCGLFIDRKSPYLGATPDGLIGTDGIVEVKCLSLAGDLTPEEAILKYPIYARIFNNVKTGKKGVKKQVKSDTMNKNHAYYYQVQGQLHVTQREYCKFAVWTPRGIKHVTVPRDDEFWSNEMERKLDKFYMNCLLPEIIDSRKNRGKRVRDPQYIIDAQTRKNQTPSSRNPKRKADGDVVVGAAKRQKRVPTPLVEQSDNQGLSDNNNTPSNVTVPIQKQCESQAPSDDDSILCNSTALIADQSKAYTLRHDDSIVRDKSDQVPIDTANDTTLDKNRDNRWMIIRDEEVDNQEPEGWEIDTVQIVIQSITDAEVIPEIASNTVLLSSAAIDQFLKIIEGTTDCFVHFSHYFTLRHLIQPSQSIQDIQIIGGNATGHWCCAYYDGTTLFIYDSGSRVEYEQLGSDERKYIKKRYPLLQPSHIVFQPVTRQPDNFSCGVYAAAFATTLALHDDPMLPSRKNYSRVAADMREHMISIIRNGRLSEFPTVEMTD